jgi:hypothetical protein
LRAFRQLLEVPDDLPQAFSVIEELSDRAPERTLRRLRATEAREQLGVSAPPAYVPARSTDLRSPRAS